MTRIQLALPILAALVATAAQGQAPVQPATDLNQSLNERLQTNAEGARWLWGTLRVEPSFGLRDVRLVDDVEIDSDSALAGGKTSSDITIGTFAGLHFYQLLGDRSSAAFFVRPQYDRWLDQDQRSRLNLNFGAALALSTNRFFLDLEGVRTEGQAIVTNEAEQIINRRQDRMNFRLGVPIYRSLALVGTFDHDETENLLEESPSSTIPDFGRLDQTTESTAVGLQVEPGRGTRLFLGYRSLEADGKSTLRDFEAEGPTALVEVTAGVVSLRAAVDRLEFLPIEPTSDFEAIETTVGRLDLSLSDLGPHGFRLSVDRSLSPSVRASFGDFEATSSHLSWRYKATERVQTQVGYRAIDRDFRSDTQRSDDQTSWLASTSYSLGKLQITVQYERSEIESTVAEFSRDTQRLGLSLSFALPGISWPTQ